MTMCPGQDTRYWKPDDVFEIPCQACGAPIEFFKTDVSRRCRSCGKRVQNPKVSMGCAQWCAYAKQCLGFDPAAVELPDSQETSLVDQLADALKRVLKSQERVTHSLLVLDRAQELMRHEGGDPRVVMAAALLHETGTGTDASTPTDTSASDPTDAAVAREIMEEVGLDSDTRDHVCRIVCGCDRDEPDACKESQIVWDADRLEDKPAELLGCTSDDSEGVIERLFRTETGRQRARKLLADV